ncbi:MAG: hypothetical protein WAW53_12530 [Candidatus Dormiibacterota bacterium]
MRQFLQKLLIRLLRRDGDVLNRGGRFFGQRRGKLVREQPLVKQTYCRGW